MRKEVVEEPAARLLSAMAVVWNSPLIRVRSHRRNCRAYRAKHAIQDLFVEHPPIERMNAVFYAKHGERGMKHFLPYRAVVSARYRMLLQYRAAAFADLVTLCFWGAIRLMIVGGVLCGLNEGPPMSPREVVAYIWLGQAFFVMLPWKSMRNLPRRCVTVRSPMTAAAAVDLYAFWYSHTWPITPDHPPGHPWGSWPSWCSTPRAGGMF